MSEEEKSSADTRASGRESSPLFTDSFSEFVGRTANQVRKHARNAANAADGLWERREELMTHLPERESLDAWVRDQSIALRDLVNPPDPTDLDRLEKALTGVIAAMQQISDKRARRLTNLIQGGAQAEAQMPNP